MDVTQGVVGQASKKEFNANPLLLIILRTATICTWLMWVYEVDKG
jgi:hypothetical protein